MRTRFFANAEVQELGHWLSEKLPSLPVRLRLPHSPFMPGGIAVDTVFGDVVPQHFRWRLTGMAVGDWAETSHRVRNMAIPLREAVDRDDAVATRTACNAIAHWGADRNSRVGATAFLASLGDELPAYLRRAGAALALVGPDESAQFEAVQRMNSTLCKVHALYAGDGLPVYESRVAVAIATLIELWRSDTGRESSPLDPVLRFPAVGKQPQRRVRSVFPQAPDPGLLAYGDASLRNTATQWADAAVRLGLLMELTIRQSDPLLFVTSPATPATHTMSSRLVAFISTLFMVGYDPVSLRPANRMIYQAAEMQR